MRRALLALLLVSCALVARVEAQTTTTSTSTTSSTTTTLKSQGGSGTLVSAQGATGATLTILCVDRTFPASLTFLIDAGAGTSTVIEQSHNGTTWVPAATAVTADGTVTFQNPSGCYRANTTVTSGAVSIYWVTSQRH